MTLRQLNRFSNDIYSNDHATRVEARAGILKLTDGFKTFKPIPKAKEAKYEKWHRLSDLMQKSIATQTVPFKLDNRSAEDQTRVIQTTNKVVKQDLDTDKTKTGFVVMMTHGIGTRFNSRALEHQIELLKSEGFGLNENDSKLEAEKRLRVVVLANHADSICKKRNTECKTYIKSLESLSNETTSIIGRAWKPKWISDDNKALNGKSAKRYFRLMSEIDDNSAQAAYQKVFKPSSIPMQQVREEILLDPMTKQHLQSLSGRARYLVTWDDDAIKVRQNNAEGVFSIYDRMIQENPGLVVGTTGYRMIHRDNNFFELATQLDHAVRFVLQEYSYFAEPNTIFNADYAISFLGKDLFGGPIPEFVAALENLIRSRQSLLGKMVVAAEGAIVTAATRANIPYNFQFGVTHDNIFKNLNAFRYFLQSSLNPEKNFAPGIIRLIDELKTQDSRRYKANIDAINGIFSLYDPIELSKFYEEGLDIFIPIYNLFTNMIIASLSHNKKMVYTQITAQFLKEHNIDSVYSARIKNHIQTKFELFLMCIEHLKRNISNEKIKLIINKTSSTGLMIHKFLSCFMNETTFSPK